MKYLPMHNATKSFWVGVYVVKWRVRLRVVAPIINIKIVIYIFKFKFKFKEQTYHFFNRPATRFTCTWCRLRTFRFYPQIEVRRAKRSQSDAIRTVLGRCVVILTATTHEDDRKHVVISKRRKDTSRRVDLSDLSLEIMTTSGRRSSDPLATPVH